MPSARTMQASLPDWISMPRMRSPTAIWPPSGTNIFEPCIRQAFSLTGSSWSSRRRPDRSIPNTR